MVKSWIQINKKYWYWNKKSIRILQLIILNETEEQVPWWRPFLFLPFNYLKQYKYAFLSGCTHTSISLSSLVLITPPTLPFKSKLKLMSEVIYRCNRYLSMRSYLRRVSITNLHMSEAPRFFSQKRSWDRHSCLASGELRVF